MGPENVRHNQGGLSCRLPLHKEPGGERASI